jgi:hypothetical protein
MQTQQFPIYQPWTYQYQDLWYKSLPSAFAVHAISIVIALLLTGYSAFLVFSEGNSTDLRMSKTIVAGVAVVWTYVLVNYRVAMFAVSVAVTAGLKMACDLFSRNAPYGLQMQFGLQQCYYAFAVFGKDLNALIVGCSFSWLAFILWAVFTIQAVRMIGGGAKSPQPMVQQNPPLQQFQPPAPVYYSAPQPQRNLNQRFSYYDAPPELFERRSRYIEEIEELPLAGAMVLSNSRYQTHPPNGYSKRVSYSDAPSEYFERNHRYTEEINDVPINNTMGGYNHRQSHYLAQDQRMPQTYHTKLSNQDQYQKRVSFHESDNEQASTHHHHHVNANETPQGRQGSHRNHEQASYKDLNTVDEQRIRELRQSLQRN